MRKGNGNYHEVLHAAKQEEQIITTYFGKSTIEVFRISVGILSDKDIIEYVILSVMIIWKYGLETTNRQID